MTTKLERLSAYEDDDEDPEYLDLNGSSLAAQRDNSVNAEATTVAVSRFRSVTNNRPIAACLTWPELVEQLRSPHRARCTLDSCGQGEHAYYVDGLYRGCREKYIGAWSPAVYDDGKTRGADNVRELSLLVVDGDHLDDTGLTQALTRLEPYRHVAHSSHSDCSDDRCIRAVVALSRTVKANEWPRFWPGAMRKLGMPADPKCSNRDRLYFDPCRPSDAEYFFVARDGVPLDVDAILRDAPEAEAPAPRPTRPTTAPTGDSVYDALAQLDQGYVLTCISGTSLVACQSIDLGKPNRKGNRTIVIDGKATSGFVDAAGTIAHEHSLGNPLGHDGGPLVSTWLRHPDYGHADDKAIRRGLIDHVPELARFAKPSTNGTRTSHREPPPDYDPACNPDLDRDAASDSRPDEKHHRSDAGASGETTAPADPWKQELATALADIKAKLDASRAGLPDPLFQLDAVDLLQRQFDGPRWLVTGLITRGGITMIGAEPKAAKTWLGTEIAVAVATGTKVCGEFFAELGTVAYFYAEDMDVQIRNRVRALLAGSDRLLAPRQLHLQPRGAFVDLLEDKDLAHIVASCRRLGKIDLLVLDPLRDIHSGEEDKSDSMRDVMRRLRVLAELLGCTVAVVHHAPKATKDTSKRRPGQNLRGSGAIHGSVDSGFYLEDSDGDGTNLFTNTVVSQVKGARSAGRFKLELAVEDDDQGEAIKASWTVNRDGQATKQTAKAKREQADDDAVFDFVRTLAMRGEVLTRTDLRHHDERPIAEKRTYDALDRMVESGRLVLRAGKVGIPGSEGSPNA